MRVLGILVLCVLGKGLIGADELLIEDFDYADAAAAQAAWRPGQGSPPIGLMDHNGGKALRIECPFTQNVERSVYDRDVELDLRRFGQFTLEYYVDDVKPLRGFTLYFRSPGGWFGAGFTGEKGWNEVTLLKSAFGTEGSPAGWDQITGIRLSQWKGAPGDTFVAIDSLKAYSTEIAVIFATRAMQAVPSEARSVEAFAEDMQELLNSAGIPSDLITDEDVIAGGLADRKVAIFAYSPSMDPEVLEQTREFVASGGKVFVFYSLDAGMGELLGVRSTAYKRREEGNPFARLTFEAGDIRGLPTEMRQDSWNINVPQPTRPDARIIGWWTDDEGRRSGDPAMILSDTGVYMGHVLTGVDRETKQRVMTALLGVFMPEVWVQKAKRSLKDLTRVGPFLTVEELRSHVANYGEPARALVEEGERTARGAQEALANGRAPEACELAAKAHQAFKESYILAHRGRVGEFRAMWEHSGTGPFPEKGWGHALDILKANGFNAIIPNMWWAGLAYYQSEYLPVSDKVAKYGDQIAQCVEEAHKRGIEVHAWKVNWNLSNAPQEFVDKMRAEGRLAVDVRGEVRRWLCASHPANFQLEFDTMLEVARKYDVDGIHFDYIRYQDDTICYCDDCRQRFEAEIGQKVANWPGDCYNGVLADRYRDFRCEQITRLVKTVSEEAHRIRPDLKVSAAVFADYPSCRRYVGQDWLLWVKEGYLDFVCPMDYTDNNAGFRRTVARQIAQVGGRVPLYPGIGASAPGQPSDMTIAQVEIARELGADGFTIFQLDASKAIDHVPAMGAALLVPPTYTPNFAPKVAFELPGEPELEDGAVHLPRDRTAQVKLTYVGTGSEKVRDVRMGVELETTNGSRVRELVPEGPITHGTREFSIEAQGGRLRIVARGVMVLADGSERPYVVRSTPFVFDR